jgi:hypothetical protein
MITDVVRGNSRKEFEGVYTLYDRETQIHNYKTFVSGQNIHYYLIHGCSTG